VTKGGGKKSGSTMPKSSQEGRGQMGFRGEKQLNKGQYKREEEIFIKVKEQLQKNDENREKRGQIRQSWGQIKQTSRE